MCDVKKEINFKKQRYLFILHIIKYMHSFTLSGLDFKISDLFSLKKMNLAKDWRILSIHDSQEIAPATKSFCK
jgi:hypothetical protein